jgi:hypothetical protein
LFGHVDHGRPITVPEITLALPSREDADTLFELYVTNVNWAHHVIHGPTVRSRIRRAYDALDHLESPPLPDLALMATIFVVTAYHGLNWPSLPIRDTNIKQCCHRWLLLVQRIMSELDHLMSPTVETLQSAILLSQNLPLALAERAAVQALLLSAAHHLQLHRVDSPQIRLSREANGCDVVELETKRRVWWNLVGTDW